MPGLILLLTLLPNGLLQTFTFIYFRILNKISKKLELPPFLYLLKPVFTPILNFARGIGVNHFNKLFCNLVYIKNTSGEFLRTTVLKMNQNLQIENIRQTIDT